MSLTTDINVSPHRRQYPENGTPAHGISCGILRRLICKDFDILLNGSKINVLRFVFSDRQYARTETVDSETAENTDCQKTQEQ